MTPGGPQYFGIIPLIVFIRVSLMILSKFLNSWSQPSDGLTTLGETVKDEQ